MVMLVSGDHAVTRTRVSSGPGLLPRAITESMALQQSRSALMSTVTDIIAGNANARCVGHHL